MESPAWLLALPGFHFSEWSGPSVRFIRGRAVPTLTTPPSLTRRQRIARQCRWLDPLKMTPIYSVDIKSTVFFSALQSNEEQIALAVPPTSPCPVWQDITGDPGWGGILAETALTGQPVVLIYNPEQNILPLYVEALALLPEYFAWRTTFCTYFTGLPETIPCQWKGVIAGSEDVKRLVKELDCLIIDLTFPMRGTPSGKYVNFARFGLEYMLPLDIEANAAAAKTDTQAYSEDTEQKPDNLDTPQGTISIKEIHLSSPKIQLPKKHAGLLETFLRRSSRFQFYFLYSIMFTLVLLLLVLVVDQACQFGIVETLRKGQGRQTVLMPPDVPKLESEIKSELEAQTESELEQIEQEVFTEPEDVRKTFEEERAKQKESLRRFLDGFDVPKFLAIDFPAVQNNMIDVPEKKTFTKLSPLQPFGAALELRFIPLFELSTMKVVTSQTVESLPDLVWRVEAVDIDTDLATPMFRFQLTEAGLEMDWQPEGLNNQYLYDTVLSSLGFLQLNAADEAESAIRIPLFEPAETEPMKISDLANLAEQEPPEHSIDLPFASELWQAIFTTMNPSRTLRLEVQVKPVEDWVRIESPSASEFQAEVRTTQQAGKTLESGETVFADIGILFMAEALLERIVWKGDEYAKRLRLEQTNIGEAKDDLTQKIEGLKTKIMNEGRNAAIQEKLDEYNAALQNGDIRLEEIENILEKLPAVYREIGENELGRFHYSVFLESEMPNRRLLILQTMP